MNQVAEARETDRRLQIINAAAEVFAEKGFYPATVEEISLRAGVGKGTVYGYFTSKEELFEEMVRHSVGIYFTRIRAAFERGRTAAERLEQGILESLRFISEHEPLARTLLEQPVDPRLREAMWEVRRPLARLVEGTIQEGIARGELNCRNVRLATTLYLGSIQALLSIRLFDSRGQRLGVGGAGTAVGAGVAGGTGMTGAAAAASGSDAAGAASRDDFDPARVARETVEMLMQGFAGRGSEGDSRGSRGSGAGAS